MRASKGCYTEDDYFTGDDQAQTRLEFLPEGSLCLHGLCLGRIRAMSGGTITHGAMGMNLGNASGAALPFTQTPDGLRVTRPAQAGNHAFAFKITLA